MALLGPSGSGKSTLLRALAGLVPHFHGGRFEGRVVVAGLDTREARPAELAGMVATVFQDPEDQVVMTIAANEVAFGLENLGVAPHEIWPRVERALDSVDALHLWGRKTSSSPAASCSGSASPRRSRSSLGCCCSTSRPRSSTPRRPRFLDGGRSSGGDGRPLRASRRRERSSSRRVFSSRRRPRPPGRAAGRGGRVACSGAPALHERFVFQKHSSSGAVVASLHGVSYAYRQAMPVLDGVDLELRRGEIVALEGPNGSGKTTLARIAAGLVEPQAGTVELHGPRRLPLPGSGPIPRQGDGARGGRAGRERG